MRRYTDYKDSGADWIGQVPKHWEVGRLKDFVLANPTFRVPHDMTADDLVEFVPMTNVDETLGVISRFDLTPLSEVASGYKRFCNGDVIFAKITPCMENGNCAIVSGLSRNIGFGSTEFLVYRPKRSLNARYLHYFLHNGLFRKNAAPFMKGSAGQKRLPNDYVETHVFPLPPLPEQQAIADYLDAKTAQIDRKIDLLTQKAARYRQLKQALINAAVTRGLDQSAPMKDSGVEWIGAVPAHWDISRIKNLGVLSRGVDLPRENFREGIYPVYGSNGIIGYHSEFTAKGPCLTVGRSGSVGEVNYVSGDFWAHNTTLFLQNSFDNDIRFIFYLLKSMNLQSFSAGSAVGTLNRNVIHQLIAAIPPPLEQQAIAAYLDEKTAEIDQIVAAINAQITKLKDLRKSLINAAVTGKLRVT